MSSTRLRQHGGISRDRCGTTPHSRLISTTRMPCFAGAISRAILVARQAVPGVGPRRRGAAGRLAVLQCRSPALVRAPACRRSEMCCRSAASHRSSIPGGVSARSPPGRRPYSPLSYHNGSVWPHDSMLIAIGMAAVQRTSRSGTAGGRDSVAACGIHLGGRLPGGDRGILQRGIPRTCPLPAGRRSAGMVGGRWRCGGSTHSELRPEGADGGSQAAHGVHQSENDVIGDGECPIGPRCVHRPEQSAPSGPPAALVTRHHQR